MWHDHLFSQRNMITGRAVEVGAGGERKVREGVDKI